MLNKATDIKETLKTEQSTTKLATWPRWYYANWNISDRESQILYDFTYRTKQNKWINTTKTD